MGTYTCLVFFNLILSNIKSDMFEIELFLAHAWGAVINEEETCDPSNKIETP
jgi:hypothetical protein